jgi:hypothetical protein
MQLQDHPAIAAFALLVFILLWTCWSAGTSHTAFILQPSPPPMSNITSVDRSKDAATSSPSSNPIAAVNHALELRLASDCNAGDARSCHLARVLDGCGEVCNTSAAGVTRGRFHLNFISKRVDCNAIWSNAEIDAGRDGPPTVWDSSLPDHIRREFDMNGRVSVVGWKRGLLNNKYLGAPIPLTWDSQAVATLASACAAGRLTEKYGKAATRSLFALLRKMPAVRGGHVLVIGSETPWVEACALAAGARHVTTLEYREIISTVPTISTMTPNTARAAFARREMPHFDAVVTYSSVEHSGLTRYGDALNPWGDLQTMARAWCVVRPGGEALVGVPRRLGADAIEWNAHRIYGRVRWPHLLANWEIFGSDDQALFAYPRQWNGAYIARRVELTD